MRALSRRKLRNEAIEGNFDELVECSVGRAVWLVGEKLQGFKSILEEVQILSVPRSILSAYSQSSIGDTESEMFEGLQWL